MTTENCCLQFFTQSAGLKLIKNAGEAVEAQRKLSLTNFSNPNAIQQVKSYGEEIYRSLSSESKENFSTANIWSSIFRQFKGSLLLCLLLVQTQMLCRFGLCILMKYLFYSFRDGQRELTFLYAGLITFVYLFQAVIGQNGWRLIERVSISIKNSITYAMYKKILSLSIYSLGSKEIGTITNATTEFHDILQNRSKFIFGMFATPLTILSISSVLVSIVGWYSLIGIGLLVICEFVHYHYANYNSGFLDQVQEQKDLRMEILQQLVSAFRYVKMQIWEEMLLNKILGIRMNQMKHYLKYGAGISLQIALSEGVSTAAMLIILRLTVLYYQQITSIDLILTVLCIMQMKLVIIELSYGISCFFQLQVVITKIKEIFELNCNKMIKVDEKGPKRNIDEHQIKIEPENKPLIQLKKVSVFLNEKAEKQNAVISNVWLSVNKGDLIGIYGPVGGGKSTLLNLIASQVPFYSGSLTVEGTISMAEQQPIIFSETIRENILFGKPMQKEFYKKVVQWSCLKRDLDSLPQRDMTKIYEGSSNLSGGQKTRIALARCFYANKDILLLDDPLSSLDAVVAQQIIKNLQKLQSLGKTIILVTHLTSYLHDFQNVYVMKNQTLKQKTNNIFTTKTFIGQNFQRKNHRSQRRKSSFLIQESIRKNLNIQNSIGIESIKYDQDSVVNFGFWLTFFRYIYINSYNKIVFNLTLLFYVLSETLYTLFVLLLSQYDSILRGEDTTVGNQSKFWMCLGILSGLIFSLQLLRNFFLNLSIQLSNHTLHQNGLRNYLSLSNNQADNLGEKQILSRFSTDLGLLDIDLLPQVSNNFIVFFIAVIQSIIISIYHPIILAFYAGIIILCYVWNRYCYLVVSLTKQLDLELKGPIIGIFSETISGLTQITMQKAEEFMLKKFNTRLGKSLSASYGYRKMFRTYCSYGVYIGSIFISGCYFFLVGTIKTEDIFKLTFAATFLVEINDTICFIMPNFVKITSMLASVQRLMIFSQLKKQTEEEDNVKKNSEKKVKQTEKNNKNFGAVTQSDLDLNGDNIDYSQDVRTSLVLDKTSLKYQKDSPPVLSNISITIKKGQKIAFIGRTGAGKSSMIQLLYRLVQPQEGSVYILQGKDALSMPIQKLRRKFTCIPQTPFLFSDTLRRNVDPFEQHSEAEILEVLNAVQIWDKLQKQQIGLDSQMSKVFENFSMGEKQLICLARAILQNRGYLILDEATSNIDLKTDKIMQKLIRERFYGTTIIAVAHRLQTVADFDKIVVLSKGQILQMGSPQQLYQKKGEFYTMVNSSQKNKQIIIQQIYQRQQ